MAYVSTGSGVRRIPVGGLGKFNLNVALSLLTGVPVPKATDKGEAPAGLCTGAKSTEEGQKLDACRSGLSAAWLQTKGYAASANDLNALITAAWSKVGVSPTTACQTRLDKTAQMCSEAQKAITGTLAPVVASTTPARADSYASAGAGWATAAKAEAAYKAEQAALTAARTASAASAASGGATARQAELAYREAEQKQRLMRFALLGAGVVVVGAGIYFVVRR